MSSAIMACYESVPDAYYNVLAIDAIYDQTRRRHFDNGTSIDWNQLISRRIGDLKMVVSESFELQVVPHGEEYPGIDGKYEIRKETCDLIPQMAPRTVLDAVRFPRWVEAGLRDDLEQLGRVA